MLNNLVTNVVVLILAFHVSTSLAAKNTKHSDSWKWTAFTGGAFGAAQNAANYIIKVGGRTSNVVSVYCKNVKSSLGNPKWYARVDIPHGNVQYSHINVNKAITGVKDPHIPISEFSAKASGLAGQALELINKAAPAIQVAVVVMDVGEVVKDYYYGNTDEAARKIITKTSTYTGASYGASVGSACGSLIFPGIGTLIGGMIGGAVGGLGGGYGGENIADQLGI